MKVRFWITSNRGTDNSEVISLPDYYDKTDIQNDLEFWCSHWAAWHISDVRYGWENLNTIKHFLFSKKNKHSFKSIKTACGVKFKDRNYSKKPKEVNCKNCKRTKEFKIRKITHFLKIGYNNDKNIIPCGVNINETRWSQIRKNVDCPKCKKFLRNNKTLGI
ncbi:MAG: hypothetical protein AABY22_30215 [Nanoarchaeota archaeon]